MAWTNMGSLRGPAGPQGNQGVKGDTGDTGPAGSAGAAGARGAKIFTGSGVPGSISGQQAGDVYINTDNGDLYELS